MQKRRPEAWVLRPNTLEAARPPAFRAVQPLRLHGSRTYQAHKPQTNHEGMALPSKFVFFFCPSQCSSAVLGFYILGFYIGFQQSSSGHELREELQLALVHLG